MIITSEKATQKSMTRPRLSVHHTSFLWELCQEFVRSTIHRFVALTGAGLPFLESCPIKERASSFRRVVRESWLGRDARSPDRAAL
jgi:hypothetical protein